MAIGKERTMTEFNKEHAEQRYNELYSLVRGGATPDDEVEHEMEAIAFSAAEHDLQFHWHDTQDKWTLQAMTPEERAAFRKAANEGELQG
jgi:hypothetical protein